MIKIKKKTKTEKHQSISNKLERLGIVINNDIIIDELKKLEL